MTDKETYINEQITTRLQFWITKFIVLAVILFLFIGIADYSVTPENFKKFGTYRFGISGVLLLLFFLNKLKKNKYYQYAIITSIVVLSAVTIELMILSFGGHRSSYYAGMNLLIVGAFGLIPFSLVLSVSVALAIYVIYIIPIALFDTITDPAMFIANNVFMISTFSIALTWRILAQKTTMNELSLQYDLEQEKQKLEKYSTRLEDLVKEKTRELSISEQKYRALFDNANDGIAVIDRKGIMVTVNRRFCELHAFDQHDVIGAHFRLLEVEGRKGEIEERMEKILGGEAIVYEAEHYKKDGSKAFLEISSKAIDIGGALHIQSFHRDITEKKKFQEQLMQSQKMESIGVLAGGIAHDFNNVLTAILGHAEVLRRMTGSDEAADRRIKIIEDAARRAGQMVAKLLSFARQEALEMAPTQVNDVVQDTVDLLERTLISRKIQSVVQTFEGLPAIFGDSIQLEQVITNLIVNAADAMPGGGTITVTTSLADLAGGATRVHPLLSPGKYVVLTVSDTGTGIPNEIMGRIFDPFFTTKPVGKGTGLGLAMVYGIVKGHKGEVRVRSRVGKGTSFEIYLPASDRQVEETERIRLPDMTGRENVLVVDDEKDVLSFMKDTLEARGYKVVVADNPVYALDLFKNIAGEIDLVITDMVMPLVSGIELIRQFKAVRPEVKMIAMSGVDMGSVSREKKDMNAFMKKPFDGVYLLSVVRRVLD
ncbi:MAG TPA: ATP-binding protein, partial [Nitrospirota bacterium]|nr:ATP-binding protein [Nitrospirota bacterium]